MEPLKLCNMCGTSSNDTAIFNTTYAKKDMNICLQCLTEGILEVTKDMQKAGSTNPEIRFQELQLDSFDIPNEVFGFNCEKCGTVLFTDSFPFICDCGHENQEVIIHKQNLIDRK